MGNHYLKHLLFLLIFQRNFSLKEGFEGRAADLPSGKTHLYPAVMRHYSIAP